jgi:signal transduction histidine kinase
MLLFGVAKVPPASDDWVITSNWQKLANGNYAFEAKSSTIAERCSNLPPQFITFPFQLRAVQSVELDGNLFASTSASTFESALAVFSQVSIPCQTLMNGQHHAITWRVEAYSDFYARISGFPRLSSRASDIERSSETAAIFGAGGALMIALFVGLAFRKRIDRRLLIQMTASGFGTFLYGFSLTPGAFGVSMDMHTAQRLSMIGLGLAVGGIALAFMSRSVLSTFLGKFLLTCITLPALIALAIDSAEILTLALLIMLSASIVTGIIMMVSMFRTTQSSHSLAHPVVYFLSPLALLATQFNELFVILGVFSDSPLWLASGLSASQALFAFSLIQEVDEAYTERDYLRASLENEVKKQAGQIRSAQAELVHSANLVAIGTMAASIVHEINNALNYINGGSKRLSSIAQKYAPESERKEIDELTSIYQAGVNLAIEIVQSLKSHAGQDHGNLRVVRLMDVTRTSLSIMKSKLVGVKVSVEIEESCEIMGSMTAMNQIVLNLISNAADAMNGSGEIFISGSVIGDVGEKNRVVSLTVTDTGLGIPDDIKAKIFEPFFTTKDIGSGTGLGLHIVRTEIEKYGGKITVESTVGQGTAFTVEMPVEPPRELLTTTA